MLTAFTIPSLLSKPDLSVQVLAPGSVFSSVEGNTTVEGFDDKAQDTSPANTKNDPYELDEQPEYCPNIHDTLMCRDCGGYTYFFYEEHEYYDARCKGVRSSSADLTPQIIDKLRLETTNTWKIVAVLREKNLDGIPSVATAWAMIPMRSTGKRQKPLHGYQI
jgi:hypothetical protein